MKKFLSRYIVVLFIAGLSGGMLLHTSHNVELAEEDLRELKNALQREQDEIRVLHAEWAYLNRPDRLEILAGQYLDLLPPQPGQMLADPAALPDPFIPALPSIKPSYRGGIQPVSMTSHLPESSVVMKPRAKPSAPRKSFDDLLEKVQRGHE